MKWMNKIESMFLQPIINFVEHARSLKNTYWAKNHEMGCMDHSIGSVRGLRYLAVLWFGSKLFYNIKSKLTIKFNHIFSHNF